MVKMYAKINDDYESAHIDVSMDGLIDDIFFEMLNAVYAALTDIHKQKGLSLDYLIDDFAIGISDMHKEFKDGNYTKETTYE